MGREVYKNGTRCPGIENKVKIYQRNQTRLDQPRNKSENVKSLKSFCFLTHIATQNWTLSHASKKIITINDF